MLQDIKKRKKEQGFTIIEVLIVLAIAGLILLIVFLAVPALERNARNTQRKNDAAAIAGAIANVISNNGGSLPGSLGKNADATTLDICADGTGGAVGGTTACANNLESAKLGIYQPANVKIDASGTDASGITVAPDTSTVNIITGYNCSSNNTKLGSATGRSAAVLFDLEGTTGNKTTQCVEQ